MGLIHLKISHFRNLESAELAPITNGFNFIYGNNGSGKTSLLEAIYYLSLGRSFRCALNERIIHQSADKLSIFGRIASHHANFIPVGLERHSKGNIKLRLNENDVRSIEELAALLPVQLIDSNCHHLIDGGPSFRRKYLDWGIFYLNNGFLRLWREFQKALKQRNAALRSKASRKELDVWTVELSEKALLLDQLRREYINELIPILEKTIKELLPIADANISYYPGWDQSRNYSELLEQSISKDFQFGYTQYGPHKADFKVNIGRMPAKDILSRGQQKLFVCAMIVSRGVLLQSRTNKRPIYLVDDLPSELDIASRSKLIALLSRQDAQIFVTAAEYNSLGDLLMSEPLKMFHVEHGKVVGR